ncbi:hypothetical protein FRE64_02640 [Euhalothece natronophila Z-M001]|uniref:Uncharacterized protein n=1 Tax=Euhalothece natronophila Z-M001 TaxID=522448 RepID=A0A5B8NIA4_9CHRO|nr:hypothetical protein [Euhalothece natronophila]QDZ38933.1 hypothetical protein FRE64_02640 [Euhalothece natronophila Z-M001]
MVRQTEPNTDHQPWWNRSIMGDNSALESLKKLFSSKAEIPSKYVIEHDQAMQEAERLASFITKLDSEKFDNPEFALLVRTKSNFQRQANGYQGLENSAKLLEAALQAKESFIGIEEIEFQYRGFVQQEFYDQVFQLLSKQLSHSVFLKLLERLGQKTINQIKSQEGKIAIQTYVAEIKELASQNQLGLQLLFNFKNNQFQDFSLLQKISELVTSFHTQEVHHPEAFITIVDLNYNLFQDLGDIIKMPEHQQRPEGYAKILQYIVLNYKHKNSYQKLQQLLTQLKKWYPHYQKINSIRKYYNVQEYKQPSSFKRTIPGLVLYQKYQRLLLQSVVSHN